MSGEFQETGRGEVSFAQDMVLLVEDNTDHAVLVQALLDYRSLAPVAFVAQSVGEAKAYLRRRWPFDDPIKSPRPTLIVLDHWLEDGTGLDLLAWLAEQHEFQDIPVVVFTSCQDPELEERALAAGAAGFFLKPEGLEMLGDAIEKVVRPAPPLDQGLGGVGAGPALAG